MAQNPTGQLNSVAIRCMVRVSRETKMEVLVEIETLRIGVLAAGS